MAQEVKGLSYKVDVDSGEFTGSFKDLNNILNSTKKELNTLDKALKLNPNDVEALSKKTKGLEKAISLSTQKAKQFEKELEDLQKADLLDQKKIAKTKASLAAVDLDLKKFKNELTKIDNTKVEPDINTKPATNKLTGLKGIFSSFSNISLPGFDTSGITEFAGGAGAASKGMIALGAATAGVGVAVLGMTKLVTKAWDAWLEMDEVKDRIENLTEATDETVKRFDELWSKTPDDERTLADTVLGMTNNFRELSKVDLTKATSSFGDFNRYLEGDALQNASKLKNVMLSYDKDITLKSVNQSLDFLTAKIRGSGLNADEFLSTMEELAPVAAGAGFSMEQTANMVKLFAQNGVDASGSVTALNKAMQYATKKNIPLKDAFSKLSKEILNTKDANEQYTKAKDIFGAKGATKMLNMLKTTGINFDKLSEKADKYNGTLKDFADFNKDAGESQVIFNNNIKKGFADWGNVLQPNFDNLFQGINKGDFSKFIAGLFGSTDEISKALGNIIGKIVAFLINPVNWVGMLVGIGAIAIALIKGLFQGLIEGLTGLNFGQIGTLFVTLFKLSLVSLSNFGSWIWEKISGFGTYIGKQMQAFNTVIGTAMSNLFMEAIKYIVGFGAWVWNGIKAFPGFIAGKIAGIAGTIGNAIVKAFKGAISGLSNFGKWVWDTIKSGLSWVGNQIGGFFNNLNPINWFSRSMPNTFDMSNMSSLGYSNATMTHLMNYANAGMVRSNDGLSNSNLINNINSNVHKPIFNLTINANGNKIDRNTISDIFDMINDEYGKRLYHG